MGDQDKWRWHYILDGHNPVPTDLQTWGDFFEIGPRHVDFTEIDADCDVSTVFVGIDLCPWEDGPPKLFETLVFKRGSDGCMHGDDLHGDDCWRYATWDEAAAGHQAMVAQVKAVAHA